MTMRWLFFSCLIGTGLSVFGQTTDLRVRSRSGFLENKGQVVDQNWKPNNAVLYLLAGRGNNVQLRSTGFSYDLHRDVPIPIERSEEGSLYDAPPELPPTQRQTHRIDIEFIGADPGCERIALGRSADYFNYYTGGLPEEGVVDVHSYERVLYRSVYPGIDIEFSTNNDGAFKYDIIAHPNALAEQVQFHVSGTDDLSVKDGSLIIGSSLGPVIDRVPHSYYELRRKKVAVGVGFEQRGDHTFGFAVPGLPNGARLVIDPMPELLWGTYYGGEQYDQLGSILENDQYQLVVVGSSTSFTNIATAGAYQTQHMLYADFILATLTPDIERIWGTYYGGNGSESFAKADLDSDDNIFLSGYTWSTNGIATANAHETELQGSEDVVLAKFSPNGERVWGTYVGGDDTDWGLAMCVDDLDDIYVVGMSDSQTGMSTPNGFQVTGSSDGHNMFIDRFSNDGTMLWGSYLHGGFGDISAYGVTSDHYGNAYVTGLSHSAGLGWPGGGFPAAGDAFVTKWSVNGQRLWFTYVGGNGTQRARAITVDAHGWTAIGGHSQQDSNSETWIWNGAYQEEQIQADYTGGFMARLDSSGVIQYATLWDFMGCAPEIIRIIERDDGGFYVAGTSGNAGSMATPDAPQVVAYGGLSDNFLARIDTTGAPIWCTMVGGTGSDYIYGLLEDSENNILLSGYTTSGSYIATPGCFDDSIAYSEGFIIKYSETPVGITEPQNELLGFAVVPNPCSGSATVRCPVSAIVFVSDQLGRTVVVSQPSDRGDSNELRLDLSSGMYMVTMTLPNIRSTQKLLVLDR